MNRIELIIFFALFVVVGIGCGDDASSAPCMPVCAQGQFCQEVSPGSFACVEDPTASANGGQGDANPFGGTKTDSSTGSTGGTSGGSTTSGGSGGSTTGDGLTCREILECQGTCNDQSCFDGCRDMGSAIGDARLLTVELCVMGECPEGDLCGACEDEFVACRQDEDPLSCGGMIECLNWCSTTECVDACVEHSSDQGASLMSAHIECVKSNCGGEYCDACESTWLTCLED